MPRQQLQKLACADARPAPSGRLLQPSAAIAALLPLLVVSPRGCFAGGLSCLLTRQATPYVPSDVCPNGTDAIVGKSFHLGDELQLTAFNHSSLPDTFCYKIGECGAKQPVYIGLREGERLPAVGGSVNLSLCTTTYTSSGSTLCCDPKVAGKVEVENCGWVNNGSATNTYIYRILKWPSAKACGRLCTLGAHSGPDYIPPWKTLDQGEAMPVPYADLHDDLLSNVIRVELLPNTVEKVQERRIWLDFKVAIQERASVYLECPLRKKCWLAVRLLPPIMNSNSSESLAFNYYVLNTGTNQPVDASLICAEAKLIPSVKLRLSTVWDVRVINYLMELDDEDYPAVSQPISATNLSLSAALASTFSVFGLIATIIGVVFLRSRQRKGQSKFSMIIHDSREKNGGFDNFAMNELSEPIKTASYAKETYRKVDVSDHNHNNESQT